MCLLREPRKTADPLLLHARTLRARATPRGGQPGEGVRLGAPTPPGRGGNPPRPCATPWQLAAPLPAWPMAWPMAWPPPRRVWHCADRLGVVLAVAGVANSETDCGNSCASCLPLLLLPAGQRARCLFSRSRLRTLLPRAKKNNYTQKTEFLIPQTCAFENVVLTQAYFTCIKTMLSIAQVRVLDQEHSFLDVQCRVPLWPRRRHTAPASSVGVSPIRPH